jgi:hypothetical protein
MRGQRGINPGWLAVLGALTVGIGSATAQPAPAPELPQPSPKAKVEQRVGVTDFTVNYSSPAVKGRTIWGELVPYGELWRTGANAATTLQASRDFTFGGVRVPAGTYSVFTVPGKDEWAIILNSNTTANNRSYDEKKNVARVTVKPAASPFRERLLFLFSDTTDDSSRLDLEWDKLRVSVPLGVDTRAAATANIDSALAEAWRPHWSSARYLLDNGGDLGTALGYVDTSIKIKPTWWNNWVRAQILAKQGKSSDAVAAAEQAQQLGKDDPVYKEFFQSQVTAAIAEWKKAS